MADCINGFHPVREGLRGRRQPIELFVLEESNNQKLDELVKLAQERGVPVRRRLRQDLDRLAGTVHHQGAVLRLEPFPYADIDDVLVSWQKSGQAALFLLLDGITDPHNLGAILRNADGAGVTAVVLPKDRSCRVTSVVDRVSAGAVEHLAICQVTNLARSIEKLKHAGVWIYGLCSAQNSRPLYKCDLKGHIALVIGSEGRGLRQRTREFCDALLHIPMGGSVDSLNAGSASAIALFEAVRQRLSLVSPEE